MRAPLTLAAAIVVAEVAVLLLRPRDGVIDPAEVDVSGYFGPAELARARDFRDPQALLYGLEVAVGLGVLVLIARRPPRRLGRIRRPVLAGAAAGAALSVVVSAAGLPVRAIMRERAADVGLVTQGWLGYAGDVAKSWGIGAVIAGAGGALAVALVRRLGRRWWVAGAVAVVAYAAATVYVAPVALDPLFNRFEPLPAGQTRDDVLALARQADVDVGEVYVIDASRRTTAANAYVAGLGGTKRVVLYDTLLENFERDEIRLVVAHELAHVHYRDVPNGLLWLAIVAPFGMLAVARLGERFAGGEDAAPARLVAGLALALAVTVPLVTTVSNQLSRRVEARADSYALRLTGAPEPFIGFEQRIVRRNVSDPDPPAWRTFLLATHPPAIERIGIAVAYAEGAR
jgi:STE24 endopeptidase